LFIVLSNTGSESNKYALFDFVTALMHIFNQNKKKSLSFKVASTPDSLPGLQPWIPLGASFKTPTATPPNKHLAHAT